MLEVLWECDSVPGDPSLHDGDDDPESMVEEQQLEPIVCIVGASSARAWALWSAPIPPSPCPAAPHARMVDWGTCTGTVRRPSSIRAVDTDALELLAAMLEVLWECDSVPGDPSSHDGDDDPESMVEEQ